MPNAKITHVVSFSSEDANFPAENLTVGLTYKKWKCKSKGEPQSFVILQLEKAVTICGVDVGNESSAFVEVLVGRSGGAVDDFQTLVPASSFMSAMESKNVTSTNRVRIFGTEDLTKPARTEKWDRLKVICTQPFNKNIQYGLSFLTVHMPEHKDDNNAELGNLGRFSMKKNDFDSDPISVGSLFSKPKEQDSFRGVAGQIRDANRIPQSSGQMKLAIGSTSRDTMQPKEKNENKRQEAMKTPHIPKKPLIDNENPNISKEKVKTIPKRKATPPLVSPQQRPKRNKPAPARLCKPFAKLLDGVVFVISGYQNPNRQILRDKAIAMGAKYKPDWCPGCTHLICAFPNTPKFNQVRGKGSIVSKQWIEDCHSDRKRLPWRRYALDRNDKGKAESEEEIFEEVADTTSGRRSGNENDLNEMTVNNARCMDSGSNTDDEIAKVMKVSIREAEEKAKKENELKKAALNLKRKEQKTVKKDIVIDESSEDTDEELERVKQSRLLRAAEKMRKKNESKKVKDYGSGCDTDKDELEPIPDTSGLSLPVLPDFFKNMTFYFHDELSVELKSELNRYITAFNGEVLCDLESPHIDYLLAENGSDVKSVKAIYPDIVAVAPEWVWECNDAEKLVPISDYKIED